MLNVYGVHEDIPHQRGVSGTAAAWQPPPVSWCSVRRARVWEFPPRLHLHLGFCISRNRPPARPCLTWTSITTIFSNHTHSFCLRPNQPLCYPTSHPSIGVGLYYYTKPCIDQILQRYFTQHPPSCSHFTCIRRLIYALMSLTATGRPYLFDELVSDTAD